ncbi:MAG: tRNA dihydrouridine synthase DusB [Oscillospiraceae bacterium]|nr:tRNA dihydrouridine synthase DusB [Oscillospiraceae bacterium]
MKYVYIKNVKIAKTAVSAPLADVGDAAFRIMAKRFGAAYSIGEMTSAKGLVFGDKKTAELLKITELEREFGTPAAVQLFGSEPESMAKAVEIVLSHPHDSPELPDIIDINAGCPVNKVVGTGAGSALMKTPRLFGEIVSSAVKAAESLNKSVPITVKIRTGWDSGSINAVEIAKIAESAGAAAITVHGRTRTQMYSGKADWGVIAELKNAVNIPVIGNGDVDSAKSCMEMYRQTGCDLVMVGRASFGRPWIFRDIQNCITKGESPMESAPSLKTRLGIMKEHIELSVKLKGERVAMREFRKHAAWYIKGIHGAAALRAECMSLETLDDINRLITRLIPEEVY